MKKVYLILAAAVGMTITSCTTNDYLGDVNNDQAINDGSIQFGLKFQNMTRADIGGQTAAGLLGNNFYVTGTKADMTLGTPIPTKSPTTMLVFDNYLVHYGINTAGSTESNTANWEYVGIQPETGDYTGYKFLTSMDPARVADKQTIKYWDYSSTQYDFMAFSTGTYKAGAAGDEGTKTIGVTAMKYGTALDVTSTVPTAYTFDLPSVSALKETYISDITKVEQANFGKEVTLKFKNLGSKVRVALYETVPGYSVKDVMFYAVEGLATPTDLGTGTSATATLISNTGIPSKGTIAVLFPHVGSANASEADFNKAMATVTPGTAPLTSQTFGALTAQLVAKENKEATGGNVYLGRTLPTASFAGSAAAQFYETVFPVSTSAPLVLRVDYTLVPTDGATETIKVKGAKAVVPSTYTRWQPNYAYTYVFKISDNTNGWTGATDKPSGLFPITFDAVVTEATDVTGQQTTITTVATPTITTYQQNHTYGTEEYSKTATGPSATPTVKDLYVQVMDNSTAPATLKDDLDETTPADATKRSLLYVITGTAPISEATVMDALENQASVTLEGVITGRNGMILTPNANIDATVTEIDNGPDDNPITKVNGVAITAGQVAKIDMTAVAAGNYAYVYDYTTAAGGKTKTTIYQPIAAAGILANGTKYVTTTTLDAIDTSDAANVTAADEAVDKTYIYFTKTKNGSGDTTYSFVSVDGKKTLPAGLVKCPVGSLGTSDGSVSASAAAFVFTTYTRNDGSYAVKVIKIVA